MEVQEKSDGEHEAVRDSLSPRPSPTVQGESPGVAETPEEEEQEIDEQRRGRARN